MTHSDEEKEKGKGCQKYWCNWTFIIIILPRPFQFARRHHHHRPIRRGGKVVVFYPNWWCHSGYHHSPNGDDFFPVQNTVRNGNYAAGFIRFRCQSKDDDDDDNSHSLLFRGKCSASSLFISAVTRNRSWTVEGTKGWNSVVSFMGTPEVVYDNPLGHGMSEFIPLPQMLLSLYSTKYPN